MKIHCLKKSPFILIAMFVLIFSSYSIAKIPENCYPWFKNTQANPKDQSCLLKCQTSITGMGTFECPKFCKEFCKKGEKCTDLSRYAALQLLKENRCSAFVNIVKEASKQVEKSENPAKEMIKILKDVLIGEGMLDGRGKGVCFQGKFGASCFKKELKDSSNQIHHAFAGIYIGYAYGMLACRLAMLQEHEPQDDRLYEVACPLGLSLNNSNYLELGDRIKDAICEKSCK